MKFKLTEVKHKLWPINNKVIIINQNNNLTDNGNFMVSFMLNVVKFLLIYRHLQNIYWFILVLQWNDLTKQPEIMLNVWKNARNKKRRQNVKNRQDKKDTKVYLTDSLVKEMNSSKTFRNQAE